MERRSLTQRCRGAESAGGIHLPPRSTWNGGFPASTVPTKGKIPDKALDKALGFKAPVAIYMKPPPALTAPSPLSVIGSHEKSLKKMMQNVGSLKK